MGNSDLAFFYMEHKMKGFVVIPIGGGWGTYYRNKLLLFINKNKGVVDEFAYREEFKVD